MPMKKFTLILSILICGIMSIQAGKNMISLQKMSAETVYSQSNASVSDNEDAPKFTLTGKILTAKNLEIGAQVDIYSVLGAKVYSFVYKGNSETLNLNKGIYIVRTGKFTQKIIL